MSRILKSLLSIIVLCLLTLGCGSIGHEWPGTLYIDPGFTEEELVEVVAAVDEWKEATDGIVDVDLIIGDPPKRVDEYNNHRIMVAEKDDPIVLWRQRNHPKKNGMVIGFADMHAEVTPLGIEWGPAANIRIVKDRIRSIANKDDRIEYRSLLRQVIIHELGHHWGLHHSPEDAKSIMVPSAEKHLEACLEWYDVNAFCQIYDCSKNFVHPTCE